MLKDRWGAASSSPSVFSPPRHGVSNAPPQTRPSNGLDQFFNSIVDQRNLSILDFTGANQSNVSFITNLGHRIYPNDILRTLDDAFGGEGDFVANQSNPQRASYFLQESLNFEDGSFEGALVWDALQFLAPPLLQDTVDRLYKVLKPNSSLLAFFHAEEKAATVPLYSYRIVDSKVLSLTPRGERKPAQYFNNRSLEKLFQKFQSVKFFLTRDHLREVIVRR